MVYLAFNTFFFSPAGDWKLIAENFVDFYHVDAVHPELARFSRVDDHQPYQGKRLEIHENPSKSLGNP